MGPRPLRKFAGLDWRQVRASPLATNWPKRDSCVRSGCPVTSHWKSDKNPINLILRFLPDSNPRFFWNRDTTLWSFDRMRPRPQYIPTRILLSRPHWIGFLCSFVLFPPWLFERWSYSRKKIITQHAKNYCFLMVSTFENPSKLYNVVIDKKNQGNRSSTLSF